MSRSLRGLNEGLQTGLQLGSVLRSARQRRALADESAKYNVTEGAYGPELEQNVEQVRGLMTEAQRQAAARGGTAEDMARIEAEYMPSIRELQRRAEMSAPDFTVASRAMRDEDNFATREAATRAARPMRAEGLANVYEEFGDIDKAEDLRERADTARTREQQSKLLGLQVGKAEREATFDTTIESIYGNKDMAPEDRTAAVLDAVGRFQGPQARAQLEAQYSQNELSQMTLEATRMQQGLQKALLQGPDAAIKFFDDQNPTFKLERRGNQVIQVNEDGTRSVFIDARSPQDLAIQLEARAKFGGLLELAKFNLDAQTAKATQAYYGARIKALESDDRRASQQLIGATTVVTRDANGREIQAIQGIRFNKASGETETVTIPLGSAGVPLSALDPKRVDELAEAFVGQPIDPTNTKGPKHTMATARQAARDSIVNSYLGEPTGLGRDGGGVQSDADRVRQVLADEPPAPPRTNAAAPRPTPPVDPSRPASGVNPVTGLVRETPPQGPNIVAAAGRALSAGETRYKTYLEGKISRNEPLTADERIRAVRFGLQPAR